MADNSSFYPNLKKNLTSLRKRLAAGKPFLQMGSLFRVYKKRDLTLVELSENMVLVVGCDSDGGIGPKPLDVVKVSGYLLGRFGSRVALMEVLSVGAYPLVVVDTLSVEMNPTGKEIIRGVIDEAEEAGLDPESIVTGSTEDNVPTSQTGIGVTVIGLALFSHLKIGVSQEGDGLVCVGIPKSGPQFEITLDDPEILDLPSLCQIAIQDFVHEIIPVGSHGITYEIGVLEELNRLKIEYVPEPGVDLRRSGGPATCAIVSLREEDIPHLKKLVKKPVNVLGRLVKQQVG